MDHEDIPLGSMVTRAEEIEEDDVSPDAKDHYIQRSEVAAINIFRCPV
jgi:hypothetical protein